jgi:hypothetical protein
MDIVFIEPEEFFQISLGNCVASKPDVLDFDWNTLPRNGESVPTAIGSRLRLESNAFRSRIPTSAGFIYPSLSE